MEDFKFSLRKTVDGSDYGYSKVNIYAEVRFDDECSNGHQSFSITGDVYTLQGRDIAGGCIHDDIRKHFPELSPFIKWHLTSTDGPMHYVANTLYHAKDREDMSKPVGAPTRFTKHLKFSDIPFTFKEHEKGFWEYLNSVGDFNNIEVVHIPYDGKGTYNFSDNFSLTGFIKDHENEKWYKAPFKNLKDAEEFLHALQSHTFSIVETPTEWNREATPNLEAARSCAVWEDATLEQLQDRELLESRLPNLITEFMQAMEDIQKLDTKSHKRVR